MDQPTILKNLGITALNAMQLEAISSISNHDNVTLISPTGTGKTVAFLLACLPFINSEKKEVQLLIVVPTRELAIQIEKVFKTMGTAFKINSCYGGHAVATEKHNLTEAPALLVGTPGRLGHHLRTGSIDLQKTQLLILDEFDKSLEEGFEEDMAFIVAKCLLLKKRVLTSATELEKIPAFLNFKNKIEINYTKNKSVSSQVILKQVRVKKDDKLEALMLLLGKVSDGTTLVFCNHREAVSRISQQLDFNKIEHGFYHGGLEQMDREKTLIKLRNGSTRILITTDLAARGLDIPEIRSVIHYQMPVTEDVMVHRNGRTARMNAEGTVYFLLDVEDHLPKFLSEVPEVEMLPEKMKMPLPGMWKTLYIGAGKKDKVNKMDIVGMLIQKGKLQKEDIGKIEVLDFTAYVAVNSKKTAECIAMVKGEKIKNKKVKINIAN